MGGHALVSGTSTIKGHAADTPRFANHVVKAMDRRASNPHRQVDHLDVETAPPVSQLPLHSSALAHPSAEPAALGATDMAHARPADVSVNGAGGLQPTGFWSLLAAFRWKSGLPASTQPGEHNSHHQGSASGRDASDVPGEEKEGSSLCTCSANCSRDDAFACGGGSKAASPPSDMDRRLDQMMQRLAFPRGFAAITEAEEDDLVRDAVTNGEPYLAIFQAYGETDPATFMRFARVLCANGHSVRVAAHEG